MRVVAGLLALTFIASVASAETNPKPGSGRLFWPDAPLSAGPRVIPLGDWGEKTTRGFDYLGWKGELDYGIGSCYASSDIYDVNNKTGSVRINMRNDLTATVQFEHLDWHLSTSGKPEITARFADDKDNEIGTTKITAIVPLSLSSKASTSSTISLELTPYDEFVDLLRGSDRVTLSAAGLPKRTFWLTGSKFREVYQQLRMCTMQAVLEGFDNVIKAPDVGVPGAGPGKMCLGHIKYGWCLSRAPSFHGVEEYSSIWQRDSQYVDVPLVSSGLREIWERNNPSQKIAADKLYARVKLSSYIVVAQNKGTEKVSLGSGVAVGLHTLLTNCHVVKQQTKNLDAKGEEVLPNDMHDPWDRDYDSIFVKGTSDVLWPAKIVEPHCGVDIVILETNADLYPINGIREFGSIKVGEPVYAVGAPHGMEGTLTQGSVANILPHYLVLDEAIAKKQATSIMPDVAIVVSSAPITQGNSGGGLFDEYSNLVALNERIPDLNGLYFAVAVHQILAHCNPRWATHLRRDTFIPQTQTWLSAPDSTSTVQLGQDRLRDVLAARTDRKSEGQPMPHRIACQAEICDFSLRFIKV
jgi:S1-C subfamily serine protease